MKDSKSPPVHLKLVRLLETSLRSPRLRLNYKAGLEESHSCSRRTLKRNIHGSISEALIEGEKGNMGALMVIFSLQTKERRKRTGRQ